MSNDVLSSLTAHDVVNVLRVTMKDYSTWKRNNRERCAFAFKLAGQTEYISNGAVTVSDPDHVVLLPQGTNYAVRVVSPGLCIMLEFDGRVHTRDITPFPAAAKQFTSILSRMERLLIFRKQAYRLQCLAMLYEIAGSLIRTTGNERVRSSREELIAPTLDYIEKHYHEGGISSGSLARISGVSTVYFRKLFHSIYHIPPMKYIRSIKIEKAKSLLLSHALSVGDVAERTGFSDIYHFSREFKKETGMTPSVFRRKGM